MSISNAQKCKVDERFFAKTNSKVLEILKKHNYYMELYAPGHKTAKLMELICSEHEKSDLFYSNKEVLRIIQLCLELEIQLEESTHRLKDLEKLDALRSSYWNSLVAMIKSDLGSCLGIVGGFGVGGGLAMGLPFLILGIYPLLALPVCILVAGIVALTVLINKVQQNQQDADILYVRLLEGKTPAFFSENKARIVDNISALEVDESQLPELSPI